VHNLTIVLSQLLHEESLLLRYQDTDSSVSHNISCEQSIDNLAITQQMKIYSQSSLPITSATAQNRT